MSESAGITTVLVILVIVDVVGNSVVCLIIKRNRDMRNPMNYLLINLAIADIIYAVFITPRVFYKLPFTYHPDGVFGVVLCKSVTGGVVAWTGSASAIVTLIVIAIERYYAVMYPRGNKWNLTNRKLKVIIPVTWICAIILNLPLMIVKNVIKKKSGTSCVSIWPEDWMGKAYSTAWFVGVFIPLIVMIGLYSRVVYALWFKGNDGNQLTQQQKGVMKVRKRVTLMVVAVTAIFGVSWGTGQLVYVLLYFISNDIGAVLLAISDVMILFNSAVNPFVYALLNHQFREKIKRMLCCSLAGRIHTELQHAQLAETTTTTQPTQGTNSIQ